jgi:hypothetical protein
VGIVYILSISIGVEGGVIGGVGVYTFMGEGDRWSSFVQWDLREVRIAWHAHADPIQASQFQGSSWCMHGSRSSSGNPALNFSNTAGSSLWYSALHASVVNIVIQ